MVRNQSSASKGSITWLKLGGLVLWKSYSLEWWPFWFPFCPTIACTLLNISIRSLFLLSSNIRRICSVEGGFGGGGGGGTYGSGECPACRAERRTGIPSRTLLLLPPRVILLWIFPRQRNRDEKHPRINLGKSQQQIPEENKRAKKIRWIKSQHNYT